MIKVNLVDYFGFMIGKPEIPGPAPRVIVWGNEFFLLDEGGDQEGGPRYCATTGFVLNETKENARFC